MISIFAHGNNFNILKEDFKEFLKVTFSLNLHSMDLKYSWNTVTLTLSLLKFSAIGCSLCQW
jgi:hypothetical protein